MMFKLKNIIVMLAVLVSLVFLVSCDSNYTYETVKVEYEVLNKYSEKRYNILLDFYANKYYLELESGMDYKTIEVSKDKYHNTRIGDKYIETKSVRVPKDKGAKKNEFKMV